MDRFPLAKIDQLVYSNARQQLLNNMVVYSGYNQILMYEPGMRSPPLSPTKGFLTAKWCLCLKNACATYQRLVIKMFNECIGDTMEVPIDEMVLKSLRRKVHLEKLEKTFQILCEPKMMLNHVGCQILTFYSTGPRPISILANFERPSKIWPQLVLTNFKRPSKNETSANTHGLQEAKSR